MAFSRNAASFFFNFPNERNMLSCLVSFLWEIILIMTATKWNLIHCLVMFSSALLYLLLLLLLAWRIMERKTIIETVLYVLLIIIFCWRSEQRERETQAWLGDKSASIDFHFPKTAHRKFAIFTRRKIASNEAEVKELQASSMIINSKVLARQSQPKMKIKKTVQMERW
jgi:Ca2+/Na+ antiporter